MYIHTNELRIIVSKIITKIAREPISYAPDLLPPLYHFHTTQNLYFVLKFRCPEESR